MLLYNRTPSTWSYTKSKDSRLNITVEKFIDILLASRAKIRLRKAMMSWWRHLLLKKEPKLSTFLDLPFWIYLTYFILLTEKNRSNRDFKFDLFFPHNDFGNSSKHCTDPTLQTSKRVYWSTVFWTWVFALTSQRALW